MIKNKKKKKIKLRHIIIMFFSIYILLIIVNQNNLKKELALKEEQVQKEISILQTDIEDLNNQIEKKESIEFLENVAREELGMVKPNEIIYIDKGKFKNSVFNFFNKPID
nr:septum formation initiator family protein [Tissierella sp.]